ncbi:MAG: glycosyltransferase family 2 protein [Clostridia bacterium]|nr:glycosyltransferase family 2 protein [Clostridia bacterium]
MMPKISVIVPVYKAEKTLGRCVDSILGQTFTDFELLLIDDGSPDRSGELCDAYAAKDGRVKVIHQENSGAAAARNVGMENAAGEYIAFVDSDDFIEPDFLKVLYDLSCRSGCDITMCNYRSINGGSVEQVLHGFAEGTALDADGVKSVIFKNIVDRRTDGYFALWNKLIKAEVIRKNNIRFASGMSFGEDLCFLLDLFSATGGIAFTERVLYNYLTSPDGLFAAYRPSRLDDAMTCYEKILSDILPMCPEGQRLDRLNCKYFSFIDHHLSEAAKKGKDGIKEMRRTLAHPTVKKVFAAIAAMSDEELEKNRLSEYEKKLPKLVVDGKDRRALGFARYLYDEKYFLRRLRSLASALKPSKE